jgi:Domain of unknown function (DUF4331)
MTVTTARQKERTNVSHHFDTEVAKDDSRLNVLDMYLFEGARPGTTAMILTTNPDAGIFAPLTLHPDGLYAFRFDTGDDGREDIVFKFLFDEPEHMEGGHDRHRQHFRVIHAVGDEIPGNGGELIAEGTVGEQTSTGTGIKAYVGRAAELWAADAFGFFTVVNGLFQQARYATEAFDNKNNLFKGRNNMATVLEVPNELLGDGTVKAWATASLHGHAPEAQVYRWGVPLFTHLYLSDPAAAGLADRYHQSVPADDAALFSAPVHQFIATFARIAGGTEDSDGYASALTARLIPAVLPYRIGSKAQFDVDDFNGRPLGTDAFDVMLSLASNIPIADGVGPDLARIRPEFPYCGEPYDDSEQAGMRPLRELIGLSY